MRLLKSNVKTKKPVEDGTIFVAFSEYLNFSLIEILFDIWNVILSLDLMPSYNFTLFLQGLYLGLVIFKRLAN